MPELTRKRVKASRLKWRVAKVDTPEFGAGEYVFVRQLPSSIYKEHADVLERAANLKEGDPENWDYVAFMCAIGVCDKSGAPLYTVEQAPELLDEWPTIVLQRCMQKLSDFNGMSVSVEARAKNLPASRRGSSHSGSRKKSRKR